LFITSNVGLAGSSVVGDATAGDCPGDALRETTSPEAGVRVMIQAINTPDAPITSTIARTHGNELLRAVCPEEWSGDDEPGWSI
jgi:hypothetical protein